MRLNLYGADSVQTRQLKADDRGATVAFRSASAFGVAQKTPSPDFCAAFSVLLAYTRNTDT